MLRSSSWIDSKKSSVSLSIADRSDSSKSGKRAGSGVNSSSLRVWSHWPAKFSARARDLGSREHPLDLGAKVLPRRSAPWRPAGRAPRRACCSRGSTRAARPDRSR